MRKIFTEILIDLAQKDPDVYLITGDLGFSVFESFKNLFPDRFINVGICEQSMIGLASGLALAGKKVYVYSIIPFLTMRCFEQIRNDLCYQNLPVTLFGAGTGFDYGQSGTTHHAIEDIAIMKSLPNMKVFAPSLSEELDFLLRATLNFSGPTYFRLSKKLDLSQFKDIVLNTDLNKNIEVGKAREIVLVKMKKYFIFTTNNSLDLAIKVCQNLKNLGFDFNLINFHTIKPLDFDYILSIKESAKAIFTIEEHNLVGGFGEAVASFVLQNYNEKIIFKSFGINDTYFHKVGSSSYLRLLAGLDLESITKNILEKLNCLNENILKHKKENLDLKNYYQI